MWGAKEFINDLVKRYEIWSWIPGWQSRFVD
jgi:hypothetical protein